MNKTFIFFSSFILALKIRGWTAADDAKQENDTWEDNLGIRVLRLFVRRLFVWNVCVRDYVRGQGNSGDGHQNNLVKCPLNKGKMKHKWFRKKYFHYLLSLTRHFRYQRFLRSSTSTMYKYKKDDKYTTLSPLNYN